MPVRMPSPRGALRASLLVWGWGQVATGTRWGWLLPPIHAAAIASLAFVLPPLARGTGVGAAFLLVVAVLAAWAVVAVHAYRRAARRRAALDLPAGQAAAGDLLWLAPLAIVLSTAVWTWGGRDADPGMVVDDYRIAWERGDVAVGSALFVAAPGPPDAVAEAWQGQLAGLRNDLVRVAAEHGVTTIEVDRPLHAVRWTDSGSPDGGFTRVIVLEVTRQESERGDLFGFLPTTSQRRVTVARLGEVRLRLVPTVAGVSGAWRIVDTEIGGIRLPDR